MDRDAAIDALALQTLQVAGTLSPADQHRAFSAVASRDIAAMAAIVAMSKGGIVAGRDVVINVNSGNSRTSSTEQTESTQLPGDEFVHRLLALSIALLAIAYFGSYFVAPLAEVAGHKVERISD